MKLSSVFDVFSRRRGSSAATSGQIPETTRARVLLWCVDVFSNRRSQSGGRDLTHEFWTEIHRTLQLKHGRVRVSHPLHEASSLREDVLLFLGDCETADFLDFLEYIFRVDCFQLVVSRDQCVSELNELLRVDAAPYYLTDFVYEQVREPSALLGGHVVDVTRVREYPRAIARDSEVIHSQVTEPALSLLQPPEFANANAEFLDALEDYRKGDYGDCLTKSCSAFESVMKVICHKKGWPYNQTDTAGSLLQTIVDNSSLDGYFVTPLLIIATLRNRLSKSHGAGVQTRQVPPHLAAYAINSTGAAILLLVSETQ